VILSRSGTLLFIEALNFSSNNFISSATGAFICLTIASAIALANIEKKDFDLPASEF
jgi:hypothetical protein